MNKYMIHIYIYIYYVSSRFILSKIRPCFHAIDHFTKVEKTSQINLFDKLTVSYVNDVMHILVPLEINKMQEITGIV